MSSEKKDNREKRNDEGTDGKKADNRMKAETDEFILRNVFYFLYAPTSVDRKACLFFNPNHLIPSAYIKLQQKFLDAHFAGYLSEEKSEKRENGYKFTRICGVDMRKESDIGDLTNTRLDLFGGQKNKRGKGPEVKCAFLEKIQADYDHDQGFSRVVSDMEKQNYEVLKSWNLDMDVCIDKLEKFIERMRNGEKSADSKLLEMSVILKREILGLVEQQVQKRSWESMATAITWLLIASLLRGDTGILQPYYRKMGENREPSAMPEPSSASDFSSHIRNSPPPEPVPIHSLYSNPDEIRPYTMEDIGNLRNTYVQRTAALEQIYDKMHSGQVYGKRYVYISGIGGCGKTELARAYAYTYREEYDEIFWFTCDEEKMPGVEKLLADSIYGETVTADILSQMDERCLLILDNCNSISSGAIRELHQKTGKAHLLVTTRLAGITQIRPEQMLYLNESLQDNCNFAFQIFCANYFAETDIWGSWGGAEETAGKKEFSKEEKDDIESICRFVWYHPMAVAIIAVMLRENREEESIESFAGKCRLGLNQAFPMGERIPFGQGEQDYDEEPLEILKELFVRFPRRPFTIKERQVLKILQLFPARQLDMKTLCGLLGDSSMDKSVKNDCRTLSSLQWIQSNGVWVTMHPLISQVLEIDLDRISLEDETGFYRTVLEKWMVSAKRDSNSGKDMFFIHQLWKKSGVSEEKNAFNLAVSLLMDKRNAKVLFEELYPEVTFAFTAIVREQGAMNFVYYDLMRRKEVVFYQIRGAEVRVKGKMFLSEVRSESENGEVTLFFLVCNENSVRLYFPDNLLGYPITKIPDQFCKINLALTELRLPARLEVLGNSVFENCIELEGELRLPESLKIIGRNAFSGCKKLSGSLTIYGNVEVISRDSFRDCGVNGDLIIYEGVKIIEKRAFAEVSFNGKAVIPRTVIEIGESAFENCSNLSCVVLSDGLKGIAPRAFLNCSELKSMEIPNTVVAIGEKAFMDCRKWEGPLKLPEKLVFLGAYAFYCCFKLRGILVIPDTITVVGDKTFYSCEKLLLSESTFHDEIKYIGEAAFSNCSSFRGCLKLPEKIIGIFDSTFENCAIKKVIFGGKLVFIGKSAFMNCRFLKEMTEFPDDLEVIGSFAFAACINLKGKLKFPNKLRKIDKMAFAYCFRLKGCLELSDRIEIGADAFRSCFQLDGWKSYMKTSSEDETYVKENGELFLPEDMTILTDDWVEKHIEEIKERIVIPNHIKSIGSGAFSKCSKLKHVEWSSALQVIGDSSFAYCSSLEDIMPFPSDLLEIKEFAFAGCSSLKQVVFPKNLKIIGKRAFTECKICGEIVIPDQVEVISEHAFDGCTSLEKVVVSRGVKLIEQAAFLNCFNLNELYMFQGLIKIGQQAFSNCFFLREIQFPEGLKTIGDIAFEKCSRLKKVSFPDSLKRIGKFAFYDDRALSQPLIFPENLEEIEQGAFAFCSGLEGNLIIPENVKKVGENAFDCCHFSQIIIKNPDMEMESMFCDYGEDPPTIWGYEDSTAFAYALKYGCPFRDIREWPGFDSQDTSMTLC